MQSKTDWSRIGVAFFTLFVLGFLDNVRGPFFPDIIKDLSLTDSNAAFFYVGTSAMTIVSGRLTPWFVHRISLARLLMVSQVLMAIGCIGFSMSSNIFSLVTSAVVFGVGFGFINVGQNLLVLEGASPQLRRQLFSGLHSIYALASLCAPMVVSLMAGHGFNWRTSFQYFILLCAAGFLVCFGIRKNNQSEEIENKLSEEVALPGGRSKYIAVAILISLYIAAELSLSTRLVLFLRREENMDLTVASNYLAGFFALLLLGRMVFTFFPFKGLSNKIIIMSSLVLSAGFYILGLNQSAIWLAFCGLTMAPVFGVSLEYISEVFPGKSDQAIAWVLATSGIFVITMHYLVGVLSDQVGLRWALHIGPGCLIVSAIILAQLRTSRQSLGA